MMQKINHNNNILNRKLLCDEENIIRRDRIPMWHAKLKFDVKYGHSERWDSIRYNIYQKKELESFVNFSDPHWISVVKKESGNLW